MVLKNKVTIVTGASKGIGKGIANTFAKNGSIVVIADIEDKEGLKLEKEINSSGGEAFFIRTDITNEKEVENLIDIVIEKYSKVDVLINNAGVTLFKPIEECNSGDWDLVINTDLKGTFYCIKHVIKSMKERKKGVILNIASNHTVATLPNTELYAAAKAGIVGLTKSLALSLGSSGIRTNCISPGFTKTTHYNNWLASFENPNNIHENVELLHATEKIATPEDIGEMCLFLASDKARQITGSNFIVDGGLSIRLYNSEEI